MMNQYLLYRFAFLSVLMVLLIQPRHSMKKSLMIITPVIFLIWAANTLVGNVTDIDFFNRIYPFTISIPAFICFYAASKPNFFKVIFSFLTVCNFGMLTSFIGLLGYFFHRSFTLRILMELTSVVLIFVLVFVFFRKPYLKIMNTLKKGWALLSSFPLLLAAAMYLLLYYPTEFYTRPASIPVILLIFALMFAFYAIVYRNFENITELYQFKHNREMILVQTDLQKKEYEAILDKIKATQIYRHDMRHHINLINAFLADNNIDEANKYLVKLDNNLKHTVIRQYCENYVINVILSSYIGRAEAEHIEVECRVALPNDIQIDPLELGLVFTNAIENAINACKKIEAPGKRKITIACKGSVGQIHIQISNPFVGNIQFDGEYPVSDNTDHGFGTHSIGAIAEKYKGIFSFTEQDGIFKTTVILNNE